MVYSAKLHKQNAHNHFGRVSHVRGENKGLRFIEYEVSVIIHTFMPHKEDLQTNCVTLIITYFPLLLFHQMLED